MGMSSSNNAQREAEAAERQRQANIASTTNQINALFDSPQRQAQYQEFGGALRDLFMQDLNRQKGTADRDLLFAMARSGLTGGSRAVDAGKLLGEEYGRGLLESERRAQSGIADLMGRDEGARQNLIGLAQTGLNSTAAAQQAAASLRAGLEGARANAQVQGLGDIFGSISDIGRRSWESKQSRSADRMYANLFPSLFQPGGR